MREQSPAHHLWMRHPPVACDNQRPGSIFCLIQGNFPGEAFLLPECFVKVEGTDVRLILGLAAYKIGSTDYTDTWRTDGCAEIARQLSLVREIDGVDGCAVFSYRNLEQTDGLSETLKQAWTQ